jgi:hypothetical protein
MKWVTWENVGVDRMACAWLIHKFIDPQAEFVFIPAGAKSLPDGAEPFDIPGTHYSHHRGHCTFHTLLRERSLKDPVLQHIAQIVDEADIEQEIPLEAIAPGLDVLCRGLRLVSPDDVTALRHGALIYDALYAQLSLDSDR